MIKRLLPWMAAAGLLVYIGLTTCWDSALEALSRAEPLPVVATIVVGILAAFMTDTMGVSLVVSRLAASVSWRQALPVKATSYMLNVINYNAALVGMAWYVKRIRDVSFWRVLGALFVLNVMDLVALGLIAGAGLLANVGNAGIEPAARVLGYLALAGAIVGFPLVLVTIRRGLRVPLLSRVASWQIFAPLRDFEWKMLPLFLGVRIALLMIYLMVQYTFFPLFGVEVPFAVMLFYFPLGTFVQAVPIAPSGLGTMHAFNRWLYSDYVVAGMGDPSGVLDACTTALIVLGLGMRLLVAWAFLGRFSKDVIRQASAGVEGAGNEGGAVGEGS